MKNIPTDIVVITTLYPNKIQFRHGIFIETRIKKLNINDSINITVIAPVPWFPFRSKYFPNYSKLLDVSSVESRYDITVYHPRYIVIPKIGMVLTPFFLALSVYFQVRAMLKKGFNIDVFDAHYYYPDGVSAAIVSKLLGIPLIITARGSDINSISDYTLPRKMILWAAGVAKYNLAVSDALRQRMIALGIKSCSTGVFRNGVDLELFRPLNRDELRKQWKLKGNVLISVGNLIELKGHHFIISSMALLPEYTLLIVGKGEFERRLQKLAIEIGVDQRVHFLGEVNQLKLPELYNIADALVLASSREGWANVLLEAMACGTPVIASNIPGTSEVVFASEAGILVNERSVEGFTAGVSYLFSHYPDRLKTRKYAEKFSWEETSKGLAKLFAKIKKNTT